MKYESPSYEVIYEMDYDGGTGSAMGVLIDGHVDFADVELFVAAVIPDEFWHTPERGFDVEHVYWRTSAFYDDEGNQTDSFTFVYDDSPLKGGKPATKLEIESTWEKRCIRHPFEVALTGIHKSRIPEEQADLADANGYVYLCRECYDDWAARLNAAVDEMRRKHSENEASS